MSVRYRRGSVRVHRHTGGLENLVGPHLQVLAVHRHTGGLEMFAEFTVGEEAVHRHTGGLEKPRA